MRYLFDPSVREGGGALSRVHRLLGPRCMNVSFIFSPKSSYFPRVTLDHFEGAEESFSTLTSAGFSNLTCAKQHDSVSGGGGRL